jgi:WD40 repeat protein
LDDRTYLADGYLVEVFDNATQNRIQKFWGGGGIRCMTLSRDKASLLVGDVDGVVRVFDINTGEFLRELRGHGLRVVQIILGAGDEIITCSVDKTIKKWSSKGVCMKTFYGHKYDVDCILFSIKRNQIYSFEYADTLMVWDYITGVMIKKVRGHSVLSLAWVKEDETFVSGCGDGKVLLWDATTMKVLKMIGYHKRPACSVSVCCNGKYVVSGGVDDIVNIWVVETSQLLYSIRNTCILFSYEANISPNGALIGLCNSDSIYAMYKINPPLS